MLELYKSGFTFDYDYNYILLDEDNYIKKQIILTSKPGVDIQLNSENLNSSIPLILVIPLSIKYLRLDCLASYYKNLILPRTLEYIHLHLSLHDIFKNNILDYIRLPTNLKSLSIILDNDIPDTINYDKNAISEILNNINFKIPKTIEYLKVNFRLANIEEFTNLKILILDGFQNSEFNEPLNNLPTSLEWLEIHSLEFNQPLANLPPNLKVLIFGQNRIWNYYDGYYHSLDGLPSSLEVLHFPECMSLDGKQYLANLINLPSSLKILRIPRVMPNDMNYDCLPDTIEIIEWFEFRKCYKQISRFPANLKKILCYFDNINNDEKIKKYFENMYFNIVDFHLWFLENYRPRDSSKSL